MENSKDYIDKRNEILKIMNDVSLCPNVAESEIGIVNYTNIPLERLR